MIKYIKVLEDKIQSLQSKLKQLNEVHDYLKEERHDLWKKCSQAHHDYENLEISKHNILVECENYKKTPKFF